MERESNWRNVKTSIGSQPPQIKVHVDDEDLIKTQFRGESVEPPSKRWDYKTPLNWEEKVKVTDIRSREDDSPEFLVS